MTAKADPLPHPYALASPGISWCTIEVDCHRLSALVGVPDTESRGLVIALHGAGMSAGYFNAGVSERSLIGLGIRLGYTVVALDRPGYGASARTAPHGENLQRQAMIVGHAIDELAERHCAGSPVALIAHSFGAKVALAYAGGTSVRNLVAVGISGWGKDIVPQRLARHSGPIRNWGPLGCYPPGTFRDAQAFTRTVPRRELKEIGRRSGDFSSLAGRVSAPVHATFAEHEGWWRHDAEAVMTMRRGFMRSPRVAIEHLADSGHNISLGWSAGAYHLREFAFIEECLAQTVEQCGPG